MSNGGARFDVYWRKEHYVSGIELIAQRIAAAVSLKRGSFPYDREMGIDITAEDIENCSQEYGRKRLEALINEAAAAVADCRVSLGEVNTQTNEFEITVFCDGEECTREVRCYDDL